MTTWLLDHDADPNTRCDIDDTPLSYATRYTALPSIDLPLRRGDVKIGQLVHDAIYRESDTLKVVEMLVDRGAPFIPLSGNHFRDSRYCDNIFRTP